MLLLVVFVETVFEMVVGHRAAIHSLSRRLTVQTHVIARLNHRVRALERELRRTTTFH